MVYNAVNKQVSMIKKCHNHTLQTNPRHLVITSKPTTFEFPSIPQLQFKVSFLHRTRYAKRFEAVVK